MLDLTFACWSYDRVMPLVDGSVQPRGIRLRFLPQEVEETFWRMTRHQEYDAAEMSLSSYLIARDRGYPRITAIPVFMSRAFRHSSVYIHAGSNIRSPEDLVGRRIGVPEYQLTACVWMRGILSDEYGVDPHQVEWFVGGEETPGRVEKLPISLPGDIHLHPVGPAQTLNQMLVEGEIDALIAPRAPSAFMEGDPRVARLFPDYVQAERDYFKRTGIFPIMHVVAIRDDVLEKYPWVAMNLYEAFEKAKQLALQAMTQTAALRVMLPWLHAELARTQELMGHDFWPYGLEPNRKTLETIIRYAHEQGLTSRCMAPEDLFAPSTLERFVI